MNTDFYINGLGCASSGQIPLKALEKFKSSGLDAYLPASQIRRISKTGQAALSSACRAVTDARFPVPFTDESAPKVGLYIGTAFGVIDSSFLFMDSICEHGARLASPTHFSHSVNNAYCGFVSMKLNIQGPSCTVCQFGLSFAGALQAALPALHSRSVDLALVGAVEQAYDGLYAFRKHPLAADELPEMMKHSCAVFFVISREPDARYPKISGPVWMRTPQYGPGASVAAGVLSQERRCYAGHMAEQALDLAAACAAFASGDGAGAKEAHCIACIHGHKPQAPYAGIVLQCL